MNIGQAIENLKAGGKVAREGWNGKNMYIYLVRGQQIPKGNLVRQAREHNVNETTNIFEPITINGHIDMKAADGSIVVGWLASQADLLAEDWILVTK